MVSLPVEDARVWIEGGGVLHSSVVCVCLPCRDGSQGSVLQLLLIPDLVDPVNKVTHLENTKN